MENDVRKKKSILHSETMPGILLLIATIIALIFANTPLQSIYKFLLYDIKIGEEINLHFIINDFLMAIFFLVVGCEIKREIAFGKLSNIREASFPVLTAIGGMAVPALIFTLFNFNTQLEIGVGIPLSTDIAFAIGIFTLLKDRVNENLKLFLLTLAVVDDLLSIIIIGVFYSSNIRFLGLVAAAVIVFLLLMIRKFKMLNNLYSYLFLGFLLWLAILYSGVHATLAGVIFAFTIPVYDETQRSIDLSYKLQHKLEKFTNFIILPLFAFANTAINLRGDLDLKNEYTLMIGIIFGLVLGKPIGIMAFGYIGTVFKLCRKPENAGWYDLFIVAVIAGIGFTMSLFISELAFENEIIAVNVSKISILISAAISTLLAFTLSMKKAPE